jgi:hypothetical protein
MTLPKPLALALAAATLALGCRMPLLVDRKPGRDPRCADGVCVEAAYFGTFEEAVGVWLTAPPATRLLNAYFTIDDEPACRDHVPIEWVRVDGDLHRAGPIDVGGEHGLVLAFPIDMWFAHSGYWRAAFVDLQLEVAGRPRCVRSRLTDANGDVAVGS